MKTDQLRNPEFVDLAMSTELRYSVLIGKLHDITRKINTTIAFNTVCQDSDDEDCYRNSNNNMFAHCAIGSRGPAEPDLELSGSGSESGSGSRSDYGEKETMYGSDMTDSEWVSTTERRVTPSGKPISSTAPPAEDDRSGGNGGNGGGDDDDDKPPDHGIDNNIPVFSDGVVVLPPATTEEDRETSTTPTVSEATTTTTTSEETDRSTIQSGTTGGVATKGVTGHTEQGGMTRTNDETEPPPATTSDIFTEKQDLHSVNSAAFHTATLFTTALVTCIALSNALALV